MVDGNNLLALTAATPLEEKPCAVTGNEPPPRTHVISDDGLGQQWVEKNGCSGVHVVVAKESDVTERMIHIGGEQIQGNETRNVRDRGPRISKNRVGGWASWTAQALFAWTRTHDEPRKSWPGGYIAAGLLRWRVIRSLRACAVLDCWREGVAARCLLPCIRALREKENFQLFHFVQPLKMVHF